jgi:hypothetical protein
MAHLHPVEDHRDGLRRVIRANPSPQQSSFRTSMRWNQPERAPWLVGHQFIVHAISSGNSLQSRVPEAVFIGETVAAISSTGEQHVHPSQGCTAQLTFKELTGNWRHQGLQPRLVLLAECDPPVSEEPGRARLPFQPAEPHDARAARQMAGSAGDERGRLGVGGGTADAHLLRVERLQRHVVPGGRQRSGAAGTAAAPGPTRPPR